VAYFMPILTINISTSSERIFSINLPKYDERITYVIVWQKFDVLEEKLNGVFSDRKDVNLIVDSGKGLSRSRNLAICNVETEYFMVMDDDVEIDIEQVIHVVQHVCSDKGDIATALHKFKSGKVKKHKKKIFRHGMFSSASVSSIDIICKTDSIRNKNVLFRENFGLGTAYPSGEEYIFITDALKKNMLVLFYPVVCSTHPNITSGSDFYSSKELILAKKKMLGEIFGKYHYLFVFLFWLKKIPVVVKKGHFMRFTHYMLFSV
jgi:hypothetical protein